LRPAGRAVEGSAGGGGGGGGGSVGRRARFSRGTAHTDVTLRANNRVRRRRTETWIHLLSARVLSPRPQHRSVRVAGVTEKTRGPSVRSRNQLAREITRTFYRGDSFGFARSTRATGPFLFGCRGKRRQRAMV